MRRHPMFEAFLQIATMLEEAQRRSEKSKAPDTDIFVQSMPLPQSNGTYWAQLLGPFNSEAMAIKYLRGKAERYEIQAREAYEKDPQYIIEHDGMGIAHPGFQFTLITVREYCTRYLAQIIVSACGGMVGAVNGDSPTPDPMSLEDYAE